jgi:hypothetical protein
MRVDTINIQKAYGGLNSVKKTIPNKPDAEIQPFDKIKENKSSFSAELSTSQLITGNERNFFVNMFPESSKQIMTHEVFTRTGKIKESAFEKGTIFDGRG